MFAEAHDMQRDLSYLLGTDGGSGRTIFESSTVQKPDAGADGDAAERAALVDDRSSMLER